MVFKLGLDIHGVISEDPVLFAGISKLMREQGHKVYIVTGREISDKLKKELSDHEIIYDDILSITTYRKNQGVPITYINGDLSQPMMDQLIWDSTKAQLCKDFGLDLMIDNSTVYGRFFQDIKTQYLIYTPMIKTFLKAIFHQEGGLL